jgi:hypothetical protein
MTSQLLQRPRKIALTISLLLPLVVGCTTTQAVDQTSYSTTAAQASFSEAQLDSLLAPIALYPDTVLSHVLIAATYPLEVVEADRWARNNRHLTGDNAVNSVDNQDWDPSVKALVAFPEVLKRMSEDLDWTQQLGDAFLADEARVMDSIQKLRNRAYASGNLDKVEHVRVIREEKTIVIEPSVERVVYVPAYDTRVVYGNWWWADYPPVYWHYPSSYVFVSGFYWGPSVYIGPRFYFSGCHWHQRRVVVVDHHHHHNHRFYDSRSVAHYSGAKHWNHNPVHRRGVAYHDNHTRQRYHSNRESYGDARVYRAGVRDNGGHASPNRQSSNHLSPNHARDQRQGRDEQFQQRLGRQQAGQMTTNTDRPAQYHNQQPRAEQLRERMNNHSGRDPGTLQNREQRANSQPRTERQSVDSRTAERSNLRPQTQTGTTENRNWENRVNSDRTNRVERTTTPREPQHNRIERTQQPRVQQQNRTEQVARTERERPTTQWDERPVVTEPTQRVERPQMQSRTEVARTERTSRPERAERTSGGGSERAEMRGGRER